MKYIAIIIMALGAYLIFFKGGESSKVKKKPQLKEVQNSVQKDDSSELTAFEASLEEKEKNVKTEDTEPEFSSIDNTSQLHDKADDKSIEEVKSIESIPDIDEKENIINAAMVKVSEINTAYNKQLVANRSSSALVLNKLSTEYLRKFIPELGKAYVVAVGHDKAALKYLKEFEVSWEKVSSSYSLKMEKLIGLISFDLKGDLTKIQSTNNYALTEMSKLIESDRVYINSASYKYSAAMKKFKIQNEYIKKYFFSYGQSVNRLLKPRVSLNKSAKVLIDKVYAFNSLVRQSIKGNKLVIARQSQADSINTAIKDVNSARRDYSNKLQVYYSTN